MSRMLQLYRNNINGIIVTMVFHIIVFAALYLSQFHIKHSYKETELIIDFSEMPIEEPMQSNRFEKVSNENNLQGQLQTNTASNRLSSSQNKNYDEQYEQEIEQAQNLLKDVNKQLKREIPTIDNLKMPEAPPANKSNTNDKGYTGDSNIEYFLQNRFHARLPIPVYLAEKGGKVKVNILVDREGNVLKAEPITDPTLSDQILSYAKTAALRTKFNPSPDAPVQQKGYITYTFVPQQ